MKITDIALNGKNGNLIARITCPDSPQVYLGIVWRYNEKKEAEGKCGTFRNIQQDVPLGKAEEVKGKFFLVETVVINQNDTLPSPYRIEVTILQEGKVINREVPEDGGSGSISTKDIGLVYHFHLI